MTAVPAMIFFERRMICGRFIDQRHICSMTIRIIAEFELITGDFLSTDHATTLLHRLTCTRASIIRFLGSFVLTGFLARIRAPVYQQDMRDQSECAATHAQTAGCEFPGFGKLCCLKSIPM